MTETSGLRIRLAAGAASLSVLAVAAGHHAYAAWRYPAIGGAGTAQFIALCAAVVAACLDLSWLYRTTRAGEWWLNGFSALTLGICVAWLGLYEGGCRHAVAALISETGSDRGVGRVCPPDPDAPTDDRVFDLSGLLQLPLGLAAGYGAVALRWRLR